MIDESAPASKRSRSRDQLLRSLHDDPRSVSRAEIKAAFADGRLGDQDLDIPVLAGMRRITELLSELDPGAAAGTASATPDPTAMGAVSRPTSTSVHLQDLEARVAGLQDRLAELESRSTTDRQAVREQTDASDVMRQAMHRQGQTLRVMAAGLAAVIVVVLVLGLLRLANA